MTPVLFAIVIAPALGQSVGGARPGGVPYESFVAIATVGLLVPLNAMFAGIGVIVDRDSGARRELLAAPVPRSLLVVGNLVVALAVTALQLVALLAAALLRGIDLSASLTGALWAAGAALLLCVAVYGVAETLA